MVQPHTIVRCGSLSQDSPGPAKRAPGVCLQEPRGTDAVGGHSPTLWRLEPPGSSPGAEAVGRFQRTGCHDLSPHF